MFYFEILKAMEEKNIQYLLVGGLAVNLYNVQRMTNDLDFVIHMEQSNIVKFIELMKESGFISALPVDPELLSDQNTVDEWIHEKNMVAFSFYHREKNYQVIDIIISHQLDFEQAYRNRSIRTVHTIPVSLISLDDLIAMKQSSGREKDLEDIQKLNEVKKIMKKQHD